MMKKRDAFIIILFHIMIFGVIYFLSSLTQLKGDDFRVQEYYNSDWITTIIEAYKYSNDTYLTWHGRWWVTFISVVLGLHDKTIYNFLNSIIFVCLLDVISVSYTKDLRKKNEKSVVYLLILSYGMLWIFVPSVWDVFLWLSGSIGYLWTTVVILLYGKYWYDKFLNIKCDKVTTTNAKKYSIKALRCILLSIGGLFAGFSQEPGACALVFALLLYAAYVYIYKKARIPFEEWMGIMFTVLGLVLLIFAPGNQIRIENVQSYVSSENANFLVKYGVRIIRETYYYFLYFSLPLGFYFFIALLNKKNNTKVIDHFIENSDTSILIVISLISVFVMTFSAGFATRIFLFPLALVSIACARELSKMNDKKILFSMRFLLIAILLFCFMSLAFTVKEYHMNGDRIERNMYTDDFYSNPEIDD